MAIDKLNIPNKTDNAAKKKMVQSNSIGANETLMANEVNALVAKTNELVDAYNFGAPITAFNFKTNVPTYADLPTTGNEVNDGYGVIADGLVYVWNGEAFPPEGDGMNLGLKPDENSKVEEGNPMAVSGGEVFKRVALPEQLGIQKYPSGHNYIEELVGSSVENTELWEAGAIRSTDGTLNDTTSAISLYVRTKKFYKLPSGQEVIAQFRQNLQPNMGYAFYDENGNFISGGVSGIVEFNLLIPNEEIYIKLSHRIDHSTSFLKIIGNDDFEAITENVFLKSDTKKLNELKSEITDEYEQKIVSELENFGFKTIKAGTNFLAELNTTLLEENEYWGAGYLTGSGLPDSQGRRWHTKKYYEVLGGHTYLFRFYVQPNVDKIHFYNSNLEIVQTIQNPVGNPDTYIGEITLVPSVRYMRGSQINGQQYVPNIYFINKNEIKISPENNSSSGIDKEAIKKQHPPKLKRPIVSFISDDGHVDNDWFIDILNDKNVKATFAIVKDWVGTANFYNENKVLDLYHNGHDIAGHSTTHPRLGDLTVDEVISEVYGCKEYLLTLVEKNNVFVPPFGSRNIEVGKVIRELYDCSVRTNSRLESPSLEGVSNQAPIDKYLLNRFSFDVQINNTSIIDKAKEAVDEALDKKGWLIFAVHPHYTEYRTDLAGGAMRRQELSDLIDYIESLNIPILTTTNALQIWDNPVSVGNKRLESEYWELGMDGTEVGVL